MRIKIWLVRLTLISMIGVANAEQQFVAPKGQNSSSLEIANELRLNKNPKSSIYEIKSTSNNFYKKNDLGKLIPEFRDGKKYFKVSDGSQSFKRYIDSGKTALIVMDPWEDSGSSILNNHFEPIIKEKLIPLINKSIALDIPVIALTNAPSNDVDYSHKVHSEIEQLAKLNKVRIFYHQSYDSSRFSEWLRSMSIDTLIYSGFASNICVIGRNLGMIEMQRKGFKLFFVPEASAAVEFEESWNTGQLHRSTTILISQSYGELIALDDFLSIAKSMPN